MTLRARGTTADSGRKLTIGQLKRQRGRQRGRGGDDDGTGVALQKPEHDHWAKSIASKRRTAYIQEHLGTSDVQKGRDGYAQMEQAARAALGDPAATNSQMHDSFHEYHQARADDPTTGAKAFKAAVKAKGAAAARFMDAVADAELDDTLRSIDEVELPGEATTPPVQTQSAPVAARTRGPPPPVPGSAPGRLPAVTARPSASERLQQLGDPGASDAVFAFDLMTFVDAMYREMPDTYYKEPGSLWSYLVAQVKTLQDPRHQREVYEYLKQDLASQQQGGDEEIRAAFTAIVNDAIPEKIATLDATIAEAAHYQRAARTDSRTPVHPGRAPPPASGAPAGTTDHAQSAHDGTQYSISSFGGSPQQLNFSTVSQQAAAAAAARNSAGDPETLAAINRLSSAAENARTEVAYEQIPAVSQILESDPQIADLVRRGLLNPRRLSDPLYANRVRAQLTRRESGVRASDGSKQYSTSTSRPATLQRGRIARSKAPVFERVATEPSRRTGVQYYRRAKSSRAPIFSAA